MTRFWLGFIILVLSGWGRHAVAGIAPSFSLDHSTWQATDIVLVTEGETIDGNFQILEVWKGTQKAEAVISLPEVAHFAPEGRRTVSYTFRSKPPEAVTRVTGARMVLFLKKSTELGHRPAQWRAAGLFTETWASVVWIEQDQTFAFEQIVNPGRSLLVPQGLSEQTLKTWVTSTVQSQMGLAKTSSLKNPTERAHALRAFAASKSDYARQLTFRELARCGKAALPVLRAMLNDETLLPQHGEVITALGKIGGASVGVELTKVIGSETAFWKQMAPKLQPNWWQGRGLTRPELNTLLSRPSKTIAALYVLNQTKYKPCKAAVTRLRDFWRSLPQLEDKSWLRQVSKECDEVLEAIAPIPR